MGRKSSYTQQIADSIVEKISQGGLITQICKLKGFPDYMTFLKWRDEHADFSENIARARKAQTEHYHAEIVELNAKMDAKNWQYTNARIRNTQWLLGKLDAARYGDKVQTEVSGPGGGPMQAEITVNFVKPEPK